MRRIDSVSCGTAEVCVSSNCDPPFIEISATGKVDRTAKSPIVLVIYINKRNTFILVKTCTISYNCRIVHYCFLNLGFFVTNYFSGPARVVCQGVSVYVGGRQLLNEMTF